MLAASPIGRRLQQSVTHGNSREIIDREMIRSGARKDCGQLTDSANGLFVRTALRELA